MSNVQTVVWRAIPFPGMEICSLSPTPGGWRIEGTVVAALEGEPVRAFYRLRCDGQWRTRSASISVWAGDRQAALDLRADGLGHWSSGEGGLETLQGCLDVDLGISPSTNSLPIRRLELAAGESAALKAAWVRFPALEVSPLEQRYTRLGERRYLYESFPSGFRAELEVDALGLVVSYAGSWERVAGG